MSRRGACNGSVQDLRRNFNEMKSDPAAKYIRANFEPDDRLALVLLNKRTDEAIQRLSRAEKIAATDTQKWLRYMNAQQFEVYVSMNTLREGARGRTKADIAEIRHVYLDLDEDGSKAVEHLLGREDLPEPNFLLNSSPEKYQVVWKVQGFSQDQAETLQRSLARDTGADPGFRDSLQVEPTPYERVICSSRKDDTLKSVMGRKAGRMVSLSLLLFAGFCLQFPSLCQAAWALPSSSSDAAASLDERGPEPAVPEEGPEDDCFCCCVHVRPQPITRGIEPLANVSNGLIARPSLEPKVRAQSFFHPPRL